MNAVSAENVYPPAPWRMHGEAVFAPYLVDTRAVTLPAGFEFVHRGPTTVGLVGLVRYLTPSPLTYDELIYMPGFVRAPAFGPRAKGWFVSVMYVSETHTLRGGREIWKLPKTLARFDVKDGRCDVTADDGTSLALDFRRRTPRVPFKGRITTLQANDGVSLCRFAGDGRAQVAAASLSVSRFSSKAPAWAGFSPTRRAPLPGVDLAGFVSDMQVPVFLTRPG